VLAELKMSLTRLSKETPTAESEQEIANLKETIQHEAEWLNRANMEVLASDAIHTELGILSRYYNGRCEPAGFKAGAGCLP